MLTRIRLFVLGLLFIALAVLCVISYRVEMRSHALKADEMELSSINYGLFNPDRWMDALTGIISDKIISYKIDDKNKAVLREQLEKILRQVLDELHTTVEQNNKSLKGKVQKILMNVVVPMDAIRADIPKYAGRILDEVDRPANRERLKGFVLDQLDTLAQSTSGEIDMHLYDEVMTRRGFTDPKAGIVSMRAERNVLEQTLKRYGWMMFGSVLLMVVLLIVGAPAKRLELAVLVATAIMLLITALLMPMIDIDARITEFDLTLLGAPITFTDQVLFYESRSILQVIRLLLAEHDIGLVLVAVLVFCFSVAFPFTKLLLSFVSALRGRIPRNPVARFFILKSAKWSMADVLVVAIFMSYLGFNGLVNSELSDLRDFMQGAHIMTTNNSALEFGFYLFTGYVVLGLVLSTLLERGVGHGQEQPEHVPTDEAGRVL
ncbi:MAG: paraquat-inducible protein A [Flavobacteriales bacterium]